MAVEFPQNPSIGDTFEAAGLLYTWDGTRWVSAFTPGVDYTGPKGNTGATGATGPEPTEITITESADEDLAFALLFGQDGGPTGISTVFRDSGGLVYNPFINLMTTQQIVAENTVFEQTRAEDTIVQFTGTGEKQDGITASGFYGDITIATPGSGGTVVSTDVTNNATTKISLTGKVLATGDVVNATFTIIASAGTIGFQVANERYELFEPLDPIDGLQAYSGVVPNSVLGVFFARNSTNNKIISFGFYTKVAGSYDIEWRLGREVLIEPS